MVMDTPAGQTWVRGDERSLDSGFDDLILQLNWMNSHYLLLLRQGALMWNFMQGQRLIIYLSKPSFVFCLKIL